jgi:Family of unknown function (DUF6627)
MRFPRLLKKIGSMLLAVSFLGVQVVPAQAGMIGTDRVLAAQQGKLDREKLASFLEREDLQSQLSALGVDVQSAKKRVAGLTDAEVARINQQIDRLPAGGNILGILVLIFVIFIITDALGATDIFPFVHPIR